LIKNLELVVLAEIYAICWLPSDAPLPNWATHGSFTSITRTEAELSIVCPQEHIPLDIRCERDWRCLRVAGTLPFGAVGILAALTTPLAEAGLSVFAVSTFDTDYLLVKANDLARAVESLRPHVRSVSEAHPSASTTQR
jgi:hypothetical protein